MNKNSYIAAGMGTFALVFLFIINTNIVKAEEWFLDTNEGELEFLDSPVAKAAFHSDNLFVINRDSLKTGWIKLHQCYSNIDPIFKVEILYQYREIKNLELVSSINIGKAKVLENSVALENVKPGAALCVRAWVRNFYQEADSSYVLKSGPFMRKFLDGYYPFLLSMRIFYPESLLKFESSEPKAQPGFALKSLPENLNLKAWFTGRLNLKFYFAAREAI